MTMVEAGEVESGEIVADPLWDDWDAPPRVPAVPELHLAGFDGPLDLLLDLAERERIDLSRISVIDMVDQFVAAMGRYESHVPIERRADWLNLAARLLLLRSRLFLPRSPEAEKAALDEAERERDRLRRRQFLRAATEWLDRRPQLGRDVFARPRRERDPRVASYMRLMEACLAVLEREEQQWEAVAGQAADAVYRPVIPRLFRVPDAIARMRRQIVEFAEARPLGDYVPKLPNDASDGELLARSAVSSTFMAALELARLGEARLMGDAVPDLSVHPPSATPAS